MKIKSYVLVEIEHEFDSHPEKWKWDRITHRAVEKLWPESSLRVIRMFKDDGQIIEIECPLAKGRNK